MYRCIYICIYIHTLILILKLSRSSRSTKVKDILTLKISQMSMETIPISTSIVINCAMKSGILFCVWRRANGKWDSKSMRESKCTMKEQLPPGKSYVLWPKNFEKFFCKEQILETSTNVAYNHNHNFRVCISNKIKKILF